MALARYRVIIDIKIRNLKRAVQFYEKKLGLPLLVLETYWASFKAANTELHLNLYWGSRSGVEFFVPSIEAEVKRLKAKGVKFTSSIETHSWGKIAYFRDSEGNSLSIVQEKK